MRSMAGTPRKIRDALSPAVDTILCTYICTVASRWLSFLPAALILHPSRPIFHLTTPVTGTASDGRGGSPQNYVGKRAEQLELLAAHEPPPNSTCERPPQAIGSHSTPHDTEAYAEATTAAADIHHPAPYGLPFPGTAPTYLPLAADSPGPLTLWGADAAAAFAAATHLTFCSRMPDLRPPTTPTCVAAKKQMHLRRQALTELDE